MTTADGTVLADLYVRTLSGMPPYGSIGEAVAKHWIIHQRLIEGFAVWQQVLGTALSQTDPFILAADSIGELISNLFLLRPGHIPDTWTRKIDVILKQAQFEVEKATKKAEIANDPNKKGFVAEKYVDPIEAAKVVDAWGRLEEEQRNRQRED